MKVRHHATIEWEIDGKQVELVLRWMNRPVKRDAFDGDSDSEPLEFLTYLDGVEISVDGQEFQEAVEKIYYN